MSPAVLEALVAGALMAAAVGCLFDLAGERQRRSASVRSRRSGREAALAEVAASIASGLSAGLPPVEAIEAACRHRHSPLARALVEACARIRRGDGLEQAVSSVAGSFSDPGVAALCLALTSTHRLGTSAMEPVRVIARNCLAEQRSIRAERAAKTAPIVQLIVALGLVPAALMLVAAGILAVVGR